MKVFGKNQRLSLFRKPAFLVLLTLCCFVTCLLQTLNDGGRYALTASAASDVMRIDAYTVEANIEEDRRVEVKETVTLTALKSGSVFTRYLPLEGDKYSQIQASCLGADVETDVYTDEDDYYLCIDCRLPAKIPSGETRVFEVSYLMELGADDYENGMRLDIIGYGWGVPLNNVEVTMRFPAPLLKENYAVYSGGYGATGNEANVQSTLLDDGKTLYLTAERLDRVYNEKYGESMAEGITVEFALAEGALKDFTSTRIFTDDMWKILLGGGVILALAVAALIFTRKKREIVNVVNVTAPSGMDPMRMGKLLDGVVDKEDVTSMIYYFAHKGYLMINLENEDDPVLIRKLVSLPESAPAHQKTLFNGLFSSGETVSVSSLKNRFYQSVEIATKQVLGMPMYEKKSVFGYLLGGILGVLFGFFTPLFISGKIGGGYRYYLGIVFAMPVLALLVIGYIRENYRYKWKGKIKMLTRLLEVAIVAVFTLIFTFLFADFVMTEYEKLVTSLFVFEATFLTHGAVSRTEKYAETLGQILGFKDFIVVTESEKIKFMLEQDPQLYYKILPYAQVLGVTDEWQKKFKDILLEPPDWCTGTGMTYFDYLLFNRCMTRAMLVAMARPQESGNGSFAGRSGGGGGFGGFGGGGHGGGGGGWR